MNLRPLGGWAALVAACLALAACGGSPAAAGHPRPAWRTASPNPTPTPPLGLSWKAGDSFKASMDQQVDATSGPAAAGATPLAVDLAMTSSQDLSVRSVRGGVADLQVDVTSWGWRHSGTYRRVDQLPPSQHLLAGPDGSIRSGRYWGMAQEPPLPGIDFLSAGLPSTGRTADGSWSGSWRRDLADGTPLVYDVQVGEPRSAAAGQVTVRTAARYRLTRQTYTADAQADLVQGSVQAVVQSTFDASSGRLLRTSYTSSFTILETEPQGTSTTQGEVVTTIRFQY